MPHEPSFREALRRREDVTNPRFLAMLASMIGVLVASFPRKPRLHLKAQNRENLFPNSMSLVDRCHKIATDARGPGYLDTELTVHDGVTSYLLGLTGAYTFNWRQCRLYFGECLNISRLLGLHRAQCRSPSAYGRFPTSANLDHRLHEPNVDLIIQEIGRRLFWVLFVGIQSCHQLGTHFGELFILPATPSDPYPPLPIEVDDEYIFTHHFIQQPAGVISKLVGFNANVRVYNTYHALTTMEMAYGIDTVFDWDRQRRVLEQCLHAAKHALQGVPQELMLELSSWSRIPPQTHLSAGYYPPTSDGANLGPYPQIKSEEATSEPWNLQYEIQKANIYGSQLGTRSYLVEKYWTLHDAALRAKTDGSVSTGSPGAIASGLDGYIPPSTHFDLTEQLMANEREIIIRDLLNVLSSISQVNMEPNGASFVSLPLCTSSSLFSSIPTIILTSRLFSDQQDPPNCRHVTRRATEAQERTCATSGRVPGRFLGGIDEAGACQLRWARSGRGGGERGRRRDGVARLGRSERCAESVGERGRVFDAGLSCQDGFYCLDGNILALTCRDHAITIRCAIET